MLNFSSTAQTASGAAIVAVKVPPKYADTKELQVFKKEISIVKSLASHQNIISYVIYSYLFSLLPWGRFIGQISTSLPLMMVIEYCPSGSLRDYLRKVSLSVSNISTKS